MKNISRLRVMFGLIVITFFSCTEEIEIDSKFSEPQIVIEGNVSTNVGQSIIKITESINITESEFPKVRGAVVKLSDDLGNTEILFESSPGYYLSNTLLGEQGRTYYLEVKNNDKIYSSQCKIPNQVKFDSLIVVKSDLSGSGGFMGVSNNYNISVMYLDPLNEINFYRFVELVNGEIKGSYIFDDRLSDGIAAINKLKRFDRDFKSGDTITVYMQCIDEDVYNYFNSFGKTKGNPLNSPTPSNPYTNIGGAILGYFSAHTVEVKEYIIP